MNNHDTIVAISTPQGIGAMAIIRMSGSRALEIVCALSQKSSFSPRYATLSAIYDGVGDLVDEVIVIYFKAPHSYTREDVCEIQCHGGLVSAQMILQLCLQAGARLAYAGEFSKRAFLSGRIDFSQVNAIARLIQSKSEHMTKVLARQLKGELGEFVEEVREGLLGLLAHSEVMIDYSEEDIPTDIAANITLQLDGLKNRLQRVYDFSSMRQGLVEGYRLCIIGKPNVGKSSVLNAILLYDRAIISPIAGTTRDTIEESIQVSGHCIRLIDTAGIRETQDTIESLGIQKSLQAAKESDIILAVFDTSREFEAEDKEILALLEASKNQHCIIVLNKNDLPQKMDTKAFSHSCNFPYQAISINAKDTQDCAYQIKEILSAILQEDQAGSEVLLTSLGQMQALKATIESLQEALRVWETLELELFSYHITDAIQAISSITHPYEISEMFDKMFGEFCLGK
ncbi:tRNA uridine-5-carboxymethylaminomethyl(34) synthesis GTPase MnmE [Helicobacter sp. 12S02634-8]|uniref:tRNA uridine-5-carboxymethylaminomethyl(34) synthesis GTPase MnmE n=1 Tax=Helicobacter sp. 12S02634-8 TaxID=1476199 RepID=UPI000BA507C9|nr:tRNA uridine-5-carboxymethylaminomethyl(34) synthesis GTPase MnmE [Helicobacter sp. 12S02634-8]PAF48015.1 tRNA uridine-5-carboxymethylaminomethyl(34) synthesis GTPase MnmE [Helicobacter sp. 12S02634-8]